MNRRETIKSLLLSSVAAGLAFNGCSLDGSSENNIKKVADTPLYGRTKPEILRDKELLEQTFFTEHELLTVATLCDIILPKNQQFGSANDAGVNDFIEFIVKDIPHHQTPIRGGIIWLDAHSKKLYKKKFVEISDSEQLAICDQIAYPNKTKQALKTGEKFFTRMRNLTLTGYFTSKMGIEDLGYQGNTPNVWDGIPEEILKEHGMEYEKAWLAKCVDQSKRGEIAQWDKDGNLIS